jgi:hypothetical protein
MYNKNKMEGGENMSCPFIDKRYGQNLCDVTDNYIMWEDYCHVCSSSCLYEDCAVYQRNKVKLESAYFVASYQMK